MRPPQKNPGADGMPKAVREWPAGGGRFKAMVHRRQGPNRIFLSARGHAVTCPDSNYSPNPVPNPVRLVFVLAKDGLEGPGVIPAAPGQLQARLPGPRGRHGVPQRLPGFVPSQQDRG